MLVDLVEPVVTELVDFLSVILGLGVVFVITLVVVVVVPLAILYLQCRNKTLYLQRKCVWLFTFCTFQVLTIVKLTFDTSSSNRITRLSLTMIA